MNTNEKQALQQFAEVPQLSMESIDSLKPEEIEKDLKSSKRKALVKLKRRATVVHKAEKRNKNTYKKHDAGIFDASTVLQKTNQQFQSGMSQGELSQNFSSEDQIEVIEQEEKVEDDKGPSDLDHELALLEKYL